MAGDEAAPCRHAGAPPEEVVARVAEVVSALAQNEAYLSSQGLSADEYRRALPAAIERLRGSSAASNASRRRFLAALFEEMQARGIVSRLERPQYGDDTVYRLTIPQFGDIAVIQKGCPDGAHSSVRWSVPDWARETYLWWLCPSLAAEPGAHILKGVNRLRQRFFSELPGAVDGIIFHNDLCGTQHRPCPKADRTIIVDGMRIPPPCVYVMPERTAGGTEWNWDGSRRLRFPAVLLSTFGISDERAPTFTGYVGFQRRGGDLRTTLTARFGPGRSTTFRA
ncbi:hypothetical protein TSH58p_30025 (plasmid) [Azospirillum sp. TSH58]|uniref:hypothetical protein n=1 Tax=Azospirillum sp. TSH58 TaxID=664962 RepID=UPI000D600F19|nr:hypothetical protein [Azospirillum sp. TSH58]AWJ87752.1 hypothetical protein TSH58p_30025 [Azospirillum sp. TSH58]PWC62119.1 hypothetical protein TSH58_25685 [Azospirillum sp. TSH58]